MITRKLLPQELMEYMNISAMCFEWSHDINNQTSQAYYDAAFSKRDKATNAFHYYLDQCLYGSFNKEGSLLAGASFLPLIAQFDGHMVKMCGVGGVCTLPEYRRTGAAGAIIELGLKDAYRDGCALSFLYPFSQSYYEKFGFALSAPMQRAKISLKHIKHTPGGVFTLYRGGDTALFERAYEKMHFNCMLKREKYDWATLRDTDPFLKKTYAYLLQDEAGEPHGYVIYKTDMENGAQDLRVTEIVFDSAKALGQLFTFLARLSDKYPYAHVPLPMDTLTETYCTDTALSKLSCELFLNSMVRVVNVKRILELARYQGDGQMILSIADGLIKQNNAAFCITFKSGKAFSVLETDAPPDVSMDIGTFSAAIAGKYESHQIPSLAGVAVSNETALSQVFYHKPIFISNHF